MQRAWGGRAPYWNAEAPGQSGCWGVLPSSLPGPQSTLLAAPFLPEAVWTQCRVSLSSAWPALTGRLLCAQPFPCAAHQSLPRAGRTLPSTAGRRAVAESGVLAWPPCRGRTLCPLPQAVLRARNKVTLILQVGCWDGTRPTQFPPNLLGWFGPARPHAWGASWCCLPYWLSLRAGTFGVCSSHCGCGPLGCPPWSLQSPRFEEPCWCPDLPRRQVCGGERHSGHRQPHLCHGQVTLLVGASVFTSVTLGGEHSSQKPGERSLE